MLVRSRGGLYDIIVIYKKINMLHNISPIIINPHGNLMSCIWAKNTVIVEDQYCLLYYACKIYKNIH